VRRATLAAAVLLVAAPLCSGQGSAGERQPAPPAVGGAWHAAPEYVAVFAPRAQRDAYRTSVSPLGLTAVLRSLVGNATLDRSARAWEPRATPPWDAFGQGGTYDRWRIASLYGARHPQVARGARLEGGRVVESWTLVSPYPDPSLTRLEPGTLLIVLRVP
jgi:hypothetical protein